MCLGSPVREEEGEGSTGVDGSTGGLNKSGKEITIQNALGH